MLLVWHGTWRRHIYDEDIPEIPKETTEEPFFIHVTYPPIYELESIIIDEVKTT